MKKDYIIWDWNGTLLDDLCLCIRLLGEMLESHGRPPVTRERYLEIFDFPISEYYRRAGFDFERESYESLAERYIDRYSNAGCWLGPVAGMLPVVERLRRMGKHQVILSASEQGNLVRQLSYSGYPSGMFEEVLGLDDFYGVSKVERGRRWMAQKGLSPEQAVFVGDTTHDAQTAESMGCDCILVGWGHQSVERLKKTGHPVARGPEELLRRLLGGMV